MNPIMRGEECAVTDERGKCHAQATKFYFGEGKKAELHICDFHHGVLIDKEVELAMQRRRK